jgi:hypothetical protein
MKFTLASIIAFSASAAAFAPSSMVRYDSSISNSFYRPDQTGFRGQFAADSIRFDPNSGNSDGLRRVGNWDRKGRDISKQIIKIF